jgi:hypothetical protein
MYFLVIKTGSKERTKKAESGERNEQENKVKTPIGSVFQGMLKGFVRGVFGWWFFGRFGFRFLFLSPLAIYFLRPFYVFYACTASVFCFLWWFWSYFLFFFCAPYFASPAERDDFVFRAPFEFCFCAPLYPEYSGVNNFITPPVGGVKCALLFFVLFTAPP